MSRPATTRDPAIQRPAHAPETAWPADQVERRAVADLVPYARNARTHSEAQIKQLARSIMEFGWTIPVLIDEDGVLIAGHGRVLAAKQLDLEHVPVMVARGWSDGQKKAYRIADNKLSLNSEWDGALLRAEITELQAFNPALIEASGFERGEVIEIVFPPEENERRAPRELADGLRYQVVIDCADEQEQAMLIEEFSGREIACKPLIL